MRASAPFLLSRVPRRISARLSEVRFEGTDSCCPIEASGGRVVLVGIPERTVVARMQAEETLFVPGAQREFCGTATVTTSRPRDLDS